MSASPKVFSSLKSLSIIGETDHYVVVDKPALLDSQNSRSDRPSVVTWLQERYGFSGLIHRLDFGTSGALVCAKDERAAAELTKKLQQGDISRHYQALVLGGSASGKILPDSGEFNDTIDGQTARTVFQVIERMPNATLLTLKLDTGRKHQIRRHLSQNGFPIIGDHLYGKGGAARLFHRPALHAAELVIRNNTGTLTYCAPIPEDFETLLKRMRARSS